VHTKVCALSVLRLENLFFATAGLGASDSIWVGVIFMKLSEQVTFFKANINKESNHKITVKLL